MPHVLILYNTPILPLDHPDAQPEHEIIEIVANVDGLLRRAGYRVSQLGMTNNPARLIQALQADRPDVVFNLFEGIADHGETEAHCGGLLEWLRIPYTGCPYRAMVLGWDKPRAKLLMQGAGLPTPRFQVIESEPIPACELRWPVILKPAREDASVGIDQGSVVRDPLAFAARARLMLERHGPVLAEEFIQGRELNVALVECPELRALPISEILFHDPTLWPIVTYDAKWQAGSKEDLATEPLCPANLPPALAARLEQIARQAYALFSCRDYARFDFRVDARGEPYLLEVNPNPDYSPTAGLARSLKAAGLSHDEFTLSLVRQALGRLS